MTGHHRSEVSFASGDSTCHAWVYRPTGAASSRVVVMAGGLGATKAQGLAPFAERFADVGLVVLVFDHRHLGQSGGEPRDLIDIATQQHDWRNAVAFARALDGIDPAQVCVWGMSFGAGHALVTAADDPAIAAVIALVPFTSGLAAARSAPPALGIRLPRAAIADLWADRRGRPPVRVALVGRPGDTAILTAPEALPGLTAVCEASGDELVVPDVPARIVLQMLRHVPGRHFREINAPILVGIGDHDTIAPPSRVRRYARRARRVEVVTYDCDHFGIQLGAAFEQCVADQISFLELPAIRDEVRHSGRPR